MWVKKQQLKPDMNNRLVQNLERNMSRVYLLPWLFNVYTEYIMWNAGLDESQAGIKIAGRNISNLRYADDTTLETESEGKLKSLLTEVKEESEKVGLNSTFKKLRSWHWVSSLQGK